MKTIRDKVYLYTYKANTGIMTVNSDVVLDRQSYSSYESLDDENNAVYAVSTIPTKKLSMQVSDVQGKVFANPYHNVFTVWFYKANERKARELFNAYCTELFSSELKSLNHRKHALEDILYKLDKLVETTEN